MSDTVKRSGAKTSEFWGMLLFVGVLVLNGTSYVSIAEEQVMMLAAMLFGYGGGRVFLKNTLAKNGGKNETISDHIAAS